MKSELKSTNNNILAEVSIDRIWGVGLQFTDPRWQQPDHWQGHNILGTTLMRIRSYILEQDKENEDANL